MKIARWIVLAAALSFGTVFFLDRPRHAEYIDGRLRIRYWEKWTDFEGDAIRQAVEAFNRAEPERAEAGDRETLFVDLLTQSGVDQKFKLACAGGNPPDIAGVWSQNICVLAEMGAIRPLDDLCAEAGIGPGTYLTAYWKPSLYNGRIYALPTTPATIALHWNKRMFRESAAALRARGLDPDRPPRTLAELDAYADVLTKTGPDGRILQLGFSPREPGWWDWAWGLWWGGRLWDGRSRITCASEANVRAYEWVQSYSRRYGRDAIVSFQSGFGNFSSPQNAFLSEKVAMVIQGVWMHNFIARLKPDLEWGAAPFPSAVEGLRNVTIAEYDCLVIPTEARHPRRAFAFLEYLASPAGMEILCLGQRKHSPLTKVTDRFRADHPHPYLHVFRKLAHSPNAHHPPPLGIWQAYSREMRWAMDEIWLKDSNVRQTLTTVQRKMQRMFDRELAERVERKARRTPPAVR